MSSLLVVLTFKSSSTSDPCISLDSAAENMSKIFYVYVTIISKRSFCGVRYCISVRIKYFYMCRHLRVYKAILDLGFRTDSFIPLSYYMDHYPKT